MLQAVKNVVLDILFPPICLTCGKNLNKSEKYKIICQKCLDSIPLYDSLFCPVCLRRSPDENKCHPQSHYRLASACHYDNEVIKKLIWQFKYENWLSAAEPLAEILSSYLKKTDISFKDFSIISLPLHKRREFKRGFNQCAVLANHINKELGLEIIKNNLVKIKHTDNQADLKDYKSREENIKNSFFVNNPENLKGKNILLIDDVYTSGATLNEAVRVLKTSGVKKILALVVAKAR